MPIVDYSKRAGLAALTGLTLASGAAHAQSTPLQSPEPVLPFTFSTERTSVTERYRPDYQTGGVQLGGLTAFPSIATGVGYLDNIYGSRRGTASPIDDGFVTLSPSLDITGGRSESGTVSLRLNADLRRYFKEDPANETNLRASTQGSLPLGASTVVSGGAGFNRGYERQDSSTLPIDSIAPLRFDEVTSFVRLRTGGSRIRLTTGIDVSNLKYGDAKVAATGQRFDQSYRDRTTLRGSARVETSFTGAVSGFVEGRLTSFDYTQDFQIPGLPNRDGQQYDILVGGMIDSGKLRGSMGAGYTRRTYDSAVFDSFGGFALNGELVYYASGLTTYTLNAYRVIAESGTTATAAQFGTGASLRVDHELLRYLILNGRVAFEHNKYQNIDRADDLLAVSGGARYLMNRNFEFGLQADYVHRSSDGALFGPRFNRFQVALTATAKL